jgi:DNA-binding CsgD family transcriptional regulator
MMIQDMAHLDRKWEKARIAAFWDRPGLTREKWAATVLADNAKGDAMLKQSMLYMNDGIFVLLVGMPVFVEFYPAWRKMLDDENPRTWLKRGLLDSRWSLEVCGTVYMKNPTSEWFGLTKKQKETFRCISEHGCESVYQIAKRMGRNYRRVLDDVRRLSGIGVVQTREKAVNGRRCIIVCV